MIRYDGVLEDWDIRYSDQYPFMTIRGVVKEHYLLPEGTILYTGQVWFILFGVAVTSRHWYKLNGQRENSN